MTLLLLLYKKQNCDRYCIFSNVKGKVYNSGGLNRWCA